MKYSASGLLTGLLLLGASVSAQDHSIKQQVFAGSEKVQPVLRAKVSSWLARQKSGKPETSPTFPVIVNLDAGTFSDRNTYRRAFGNSRNLAAMRGQIRSTQNRAISQLFPGAASRVINRYENMFAFSIDLTAAEIEMVAQNMDVSLVEERPIFRRMDTEAHGLSGIAQAQSLGHTGAGSVIAIIDDGIDHDHPAFGGQSSFPNSKILGGWDFADNDSNPRIDCLDQSHGTAVTGVATGNGGGVIGSAPDAKVVFLKVQKNSECGQPSLSGDVAAAIDWAVSNKTTYDIDIISMSLGGGSFTSTCDSSSQAYLSAVDAANSSGMIVLAASGNDGLCNQISHPSCMTDIISVGAVYDSAMGSSGSCVNPNSCGNTQSHQTCAAIGMVACFDDSQADGVTCYSNSASFLDILAPSNCATTAATGGGIESCFSGTSSATPYAAGVAATLLEAAGGSGSLNNDAMRNLLTQNGVSVTDSKNNRSTPRVDAIAAINALGGGGGNPGPGELQNGVTESGLSGSTGDELHYTMVVPADVDTLSFNITGSSGDADLYVRYGAAPTLNDHDCRPWLNGSNETCDMSSPQGGTYYVMVQAYSNFSGVSLTGNYTTIQPNVLPQASFTFSSTDLDVSFTDTSIDTDGSIASRSWSFGDGGSSTAANPSHSYAAEGTYTVSLIVTDNRGGSDSASASVTVTAPVGGGAPCTGCDAYAGNLTGSNDTETQPDGTYYYSSTSGTHEGWLEGPGSADFDLELYKWSGGRWSKVDSSTSSSSSEYISYSGSRGYYIWQVKSYSGSGNYDFWLKRP